ncbi:MAG: hypothetical protein GKR91_12710 [Pseudomonadales bacterium]|nr:hypothetical protein [Pseudomonadales bacterium]
MNIRRTLTALAAAAVAGLMVLVLPVLAHHASTPFYDPENVIDLEGSVTRFVFRNPHAFLFIDVTDESGEVSEWQVELGAPVGLRRIGWTPETLPIGMEVKMTGRRSRAEGSQGVCCVRMTRADGSPVLEGGAVRERTQD